MPQGVEIRHAESNHIIRSRTERKNVQFDAAVLISGFEGLNGRTEAFGTHYADLFIWKI